MTVRQFRSHPEWPAQWKKELDTNRILQLVLQVMEDNHPARLRVMGDIKGDVSPTMAAIELGDTRGYSKYGNGLKLLAEQLPESVDIGEPTYSEPPKEEK
jgi:hypothetical protein